MRGIIYALNRYEGLRVLKEIVGDAALKDLHHSRYVNTANKIFVEFENGDIWTVFTSADSTRGYKWDCCFIDKRFSQEVIETQIFPHASGAYANIALDRRVSYF